MPDRLVREDCARMYRQQPLSWREASEESVDDVGMSLELGESPGEHEVTARNMKMISLAKSMTIPRKDKSDRQIRVSATFKRKLAAAGLNRTIQSLDVASLRQLLPNSKESRENRPLSPKATEFGAESVDEEEELNRDERQTLRREKEVDRQAASTLSVGSVGSIVP